jgi:hypothetical protein
MTKNMASGQFGINIIVYVCAAFAKEAKIRKANVTVISSETVNVPLRPIYIV